MKVTINDAAESYETAVSLKSGTEPHLVSVFRLLHLNLVSTCETLLEKDENCYRKLMRFPRYPYVVFGTSIFF